jgi:hypothetical protein
VLSCKKKIKMQQMMELLLKKMMAWGEKIDAETRAIDARTEAVRRMMDVKHEVIVAESKPEMEIKTMACQEMEARPEEEEPTPVDMKPEEAEQREVPVEDGEVMPVGEPKKKRRRYRKLAAERRRQEPKYLIWDNCKPQKKLAVARTWTSHRATVARPKGKRSDKRMSRRATVARRKRDIVKCTSPGKVSSKERTGRF